VLLDTLAMDDIGALSSPSRDRLAGHTVNGVAFAHCDAGVHNTLGLLEVARAPEMPVSCGRGNIQGRPAPDGWRKSTDALYGAQVQGERRAVTPGSRTAGQPSPLPREIVVVALGPLTNLAGHSGRAVAGERIKRSSSWAGR
jgi:hypothetical protein